MIAARRTLFAGAAAALPMPLLRAAAQPAAAPKPYRPHTISTPDGLTIAAQEWGNPAGPEILLIHGYSQCHMSWARQTGDAELAREFRLVTYDLRGHGGSDKPLDGARYKDGPAWAAELMAVLDTVGLRRPVLVPWSYGGRVIADYLSAYGPDRLAGIDYVAAAVKAGAPFVGTSVAPLLGGMVRPEIDRNLASTRAFLDACFARAPSDADMATMLAFNMACPWQARAGMNGRPLDVDAMMRTLRLPVLVTHGRLDRLWLTAMAEHTAGLVPGATLSLYDGIGHSPFWEDAPRFNRELAAFVRAVWHP